LIIKPVWKYRLQKAIWNGLDWIFPPACGGCGKIGERWCEECQQKLIFVPEPICEVCGLPQNKRGICESCSISRPQFRALRSWVVFEGPVRKAIHTLKYKRNHGGLGETLAEPLSKFVQSLSWKLDIVIPIPLSEQRMRERGYNQVSLFSSPLSDILELDYQPSAIKRIRNTQSQVGKNAVQRNENVQGAFIAERLKVREKAILLTDDVATTGSTLAEASKALIKAGASEVYALTLARALPHHGLNIV